MRPFSWLLQKPVSKPRQTAPSFRPQVDALDDRLAPHAGLWTSAGLDNVGIFSSFNSPTSQVATHVAVISEPDTYSGGQTRLYVVALDADNRPVRDYTGTIHFTSTDGSATLPDDYTFTAADHGRKSFTATLSTQGIQTVTATDTATATITGSAKIDVLAPQVATSFLVRIGPAYAGESTQVLVVALDANNRPITNYTGTVHLTSSDSGATLPADYTFTASDHGYHVFSVTPSAAGSFTVTATDTTTSSVVGSATTTVAAAQVATKLFTFVRPVAKTGSTLTVYVVALDANNRPVQNYTGTVAITSSDSAATLPANYTFTAADRGVHAFTITLATAGSTTITATDSATASLIGTSTVRVIDPSTLPGFGFGWGNNFGGGLGFGGGKVGGWER